MKYIGTLTLALVALGWNAAAQAPAGSRVLLRVQNTVSSRTAKPGDSIYLVTVTPLAAEGKIVIPVGSQVRAEVTDVRKGASFHRRGELAIELRSVTLIGGTSAPVTGKMIAMDRDSGEPRGGPAQMDRLALGSAASPLAIGGIVGILSGSGDGFRIGTAVGLGARLLFLAIEPGREVVIRPGSQMEAVLEAPLDLQHP
jgi:hypothetical protein